MTTQATTKLFDPRSPDALAMLPGSEPREGAPGSGWFILAPLPGGKTITIWPSGTVVVDGDPAFPVGISTQVAGLNEGYDWPIPPGIINLVEMLGGNVVRPKAG